jgi:hypothetical protein
VCLMKLCTSRTTRRREVAAPPQQYRSPFLRELLPGLAHLFKTYHELSVASGASLGCIDAAGVLCWQLLSSTETTQTTRSNAHKLLSVLGPTQKKLRRLNRDTCTTILRLENHLCGGATYAATHVTPSSLGWATHAAIIRTIEHFSANQHLLPRSKNERLQNYWMAFTGNTSVHLAAADPLRPLMTPATVRNTVARMWLSNALSNEAKEKADISEALSQFASTRWSILEEPLQAPPSRDQHALHAARAALDALPNADIVELWRRMLVLHAVWQSCVLNTPLLLTPDFDAQHHCSTAKLAAEATVGTLRHANFILDRYTRPTASPFYYDNWDQL